MTKRLQHPSKAENALQPRRKDVNMPRRMNGNIVYARNENVVTRKVGEDVVVVPIRHNVGDLDSVYTFNEVAARVWSLVDGERPSGAQLDAVCDEFDVARDVAERDLEELLASLESAGLIARKP